MSLPQGLHLLVSAWAVLGQTGARFKVGAHFVWGGDTEHPGWVIKHVMGIGLIRSTGIVGTV